MRDIPILIGGQGEKKTLRLVAEYAHIWHGFTTAETYPGKAAVLDRHCADVGRDPSTIERSAGVETGERRRHDAARRRRRTRRPRRQPADRRRQRPRLRPDRRRGAVPLARRPA